MYIYMSICQDYGAPKGFVKMMLYIHQRVNDESVFVVSDSLLDSVCTRTAFIHTLPFSSSFS